MLFSYPLSAFDPEEDLVDVIDLNIEMISLKHPTGCQWASLSTDIQNDEGMLKHPIPQDVSEHIF